MGCGCSGSECHSSSTQPTEHNTHLILTIQLMRAYSIACPLACLPPSSAPTRVQQGSCFQVRGHAGCALAAASSPAPAMLQADQMASSSIPGVGCRKAIFSCSSHSCTPAGSLALACLPCHIQAPQFSSAGAQDSSRDPAPPKQGSTAEGSCQAWKSLSLLYVNANRHQAPRAQVKLCHR